MAPDGLSIAGATVVARPAPLGGGASAGAGVRGARATSTRQGSFALPLGEGTYSLEVRVPGFTAAVVHEVTGGRADSVGTIRLTRPALAAGRVVDAGGGPVAGADVELSRGDTLEPGTHLGRTRTDRDGAFRLAAAPAQPTRLRVSAAGFAPYERRLDGRPFQGPLRVALGPGGTVRGRVLRADGRPAAGAAVEARGARARAGGDGRFELGGVQPGIAAVEARGGGGAGWAEVLVREGGTARADVELMAAAAAAGTVVDAVTGRAVAGAKVKRIEIEGGLAAFLGVSEDPRLFATAATGAGGRFRLAGLVPGELALSATARGYVASAPHPVHVRPGATARVRLALEPMARVSGRVVDAGGRPAAGARVSPRELPGADQISTRFAVGVTAPEIVATTGAAGEFTLFVPAGTGRASLAASAPGHAPAAGAAFRVEPGGVRGRLMLRLAAGRSLRGLVRDARGRPVAGAAVTASALRPLAAGIAAEPPHAATRAGGRFRLTGLVPGPHLVEVRSPRHVAETVRVPGGTRRAAPIVLRRSAPVTGVVADRRGVPLRGVSVIGSALRGRYEGRAETDGSGRFTLHGLPAGVRATVDVLADGYDPASATARRTPAAGVRVRVRPAAGLPGRVVDAATGRPLTVFRVHFLGGSTGAGGLTALPDERTFASAGGAFRWLDLPSGRWSFAAAAPGYRPAVRRGLRTSPSAPAEAVFALRPGTALAGRAVDARSRRPLANAIVSARPARGPAPPVIAATDAAGRFRLDGLAPGRLVVTAREPSHRDRSVAVDVPRRGALELAVEPR